METIGQEERKEEENQRWGEKKESLFLGGDEVDGDEVDGEERDYSSGIDTELSAILQETSPRSFSRSKDWLFPPPTIYTDVSFVP